MKALIIGQDGCAHPFAWRLAQSPAVTSLYTAPGNYGTNLVGANLQFDLTDVDAIAAWAAEQKIDLTVVASPVAAAYGAVDVFREAHLRVVGAERALAVLESSRRLFLQFAASAGLPVPRFKVVEAVAALPEAVQEFGSTEYPLLVTAENADGLFSSCRLATDSSNVVQEANALLPSGRHRAPDTLIVESYSSAARWSLTVLSDGATLLPVGQAHCYRRAFDGDTGPIVRGMGAFSTPGDADLQTVQLAMRVIVAPFVDALAGRGQPLRGPLCLELSGSGSDLTLHGVQFSLGDLESHVLLPRWEDDLYIALDALADTALAELKPFRISSGTACSVVLASDGFPNEYETGYGILGLGEAPSNTLVFHLSTRSPQRKQGDTVQPKIEREANALGRGISSWIMPSRGRGRRVDSDASRRSGDPYTQVVTAGGLVLSVVGKGRNPADARAAAYRGADAISYTGRWSRTDIAAELH